MIAADNIWFTCMTMNTNPIHLDAEYASYHPDAREILTATLNLDAIGDLRASWGIFRDRRTDLYGPVCTLDGFVPRKAGAAT